MQDHWTEADHAACDACQCMRELADVAIDMYRRLRAQYPGRKLHQLCGPMTTGGLGSPELNFKLFGHTIDIGRERGLLVVNQIPFQRTMGRLIDRTRVGYHMEILEEFYYHVFWSGLVDCTPFLPGWRQSFGAKWEYETVRQIRGIQRRIYPWPWYQEALRRTQQTVQAA